MTSLLLLLATVARAADCPAGTGLADLHAELRAAEAAFGGMDLDGFAAHHGRAASLLPCLDEPVAPADAAAVHRVEALAAFMAEDRAGTVASFRAAAALDPSWRLDEALAPPGHPLREQLETARVLPPSPRVDLGETGELVIRVDGTRDVGRPTDQPTVLQGLTPEGAIAGTSLVGIGAPLPGWVPTGPARPRTDAATADRKGPRWVLLAPTAAAGVGAAGLYGWAWASRARYLDETTPYSDLDALRSRTKGATVGAGVLGGVALGLGAATVLTWQW